MLSFCILCVEHLSDKGNWLLQLSLSSLEQSKGSESQGIGRFVSFVFAHRIVVLYESLELCALRLMNGFALNE